MSLKYREHFNARLNLLLALPEDWQEVANPRVHALYAGSRDGNYTPSLAIEVYRLKDITPTSYKEAAEAASQKMQAKGATLELTETEIDHQPAALHTYSWVDPATSIVAIQRQIFVQIEDILFCFIFSLSKDLLDRYFPVVEEITGSIRFVRPTVFSSWVDRVNYARLDEPDKPE